MPPQSQIPQFQMTVGMKRKMEVEVDGGNSAPKKRIEEPVILEGEPAQSIQFSPPRTNDFPLDTVDTVSPVSADSSDSSDSSESSESSLRNEEDQEVPTAKRRLEDGEETPTKKICSFKELSEDSSRPPSTMEEPLIHPIQEENKENLVCLKSITENQNFDSILAKTLLAARADRKAELSPKVVVEHQDLPSIYELGQIRDFNSQDDESDSDDESSMFDTPPKSHFDRFWTTSGVSNTTTTPPLVSTYQFLDHTNQRIECDENGKSYLQLGTMNHHHIPVTPVLQPKPTILAPRRPIPACRPSPPHRPPNPTPPCEHAHMSPPRGCSASCYRQQRSDMLSLSLHKLHMARQRSDSSLRRSVLICNMLRYIEEESNMEQRQHEAAYHQEQEQEQEQPYWNPAQQSFNPPPPPTPNSYRENSFSSEGGFEAPLKDFNSAFRQTPVPPSESEGEEEREINWSSVLSLTSQNELDPMNNNSFSESGGLWPAVGSDLTEVDLTQTSFDDISWKLSPISADEVMKAFPEDNMFQCAA